MGWLGQRALRGTLLTVLVVFTVASAAGVVRLMPWLLSPEVPLRVALPFARALAAVATETAFLLGIPLGFALAASRAVERGELRALEALGVSPLRLALGQVGPALLAATIALLACSAWGSSSNVPGRFAAQLVEQGRSSCLSAREARSATVPLVGVTWLCFPGEPPRVAGPLPGTSGRAWFSATSLAPSDDLREVALTNLEIATRAEPGQRRLTLRTRSGVVRGLPAWGRSAKLTSLQRSGLSAITAFLLAIGGIFLALRRRLERRWQAILAGGLPAVVALALLHRLDASQLGPAAYTLVPIAGGLVLLPLAGLARRVARAPLR